MSIDNLNSVADTVNKRIRSPMVGSIMLAGILYNWEPLTILIFANSEISKKIDDFKSSLTLADIAIPLAIGIFFAIAPPWLNLLTNKLIDFPIFLSSQNSDRWAVRRARERTALEETLADEANARRVRQEAEERENEARSKADTTHLEQELEKKKLYFKKKMELEIENAETEVNKLTASMNEKKALNKENLAKLEAEASRLENALRKRIDQVKKDEQESRGNPEAYFDINEPIQTGAKTILRGGFTDQELEIIDRIPPDGFVLISSDSDWTTLMPIDGQNRNPIEKQALKASNERVESALYRLMQGGFLKHTSEEDMFTLSDFGSKLAIGRIV